MQITNSEVCDRVNVGLHIKQIKPPLVGEHAFLLTWFVYKTAHSYSYNGPPRMFSLFIIQSYATNHNKKDD